MSVEFPKQLEGNALWMHCGVHHPTPSPIAPSAKLSTDFRARLLSCRGLHCASFLIGCCNMSHGRGATWQ